MGIMDTTDITREVDMDRQEPSGKCTSGYIYEATSLYADSISLMDSRHKPKRPGRKKTIGRNGVNEVVVLHEVDHDYLQLGV